MPATRSRAGHDGTTSASGQADAVARLARRVNAATDGVPQDIEWAIDPDDGLWPATGAWPDSPQPSADALGHASDRQYVATDAAATVNPKFIQG